MNFICARGVLVALVFMACVPRLSRALEPGDIESGVAESQRHFARMADEPSINPNAIAEQNAPPCRSRVWDHLEQCGWPGPSNTGPDPSQCPGNTLADGPVIPVA
jgi:hypothetical protein